MPKLENVQKIRFLTTTKIAGKPYMKGVVISAPFTDEILKEVQYNDRLVAAGRAFQCTLEVLERTVPAVAPAFSMPAVPVVDETEKSEPTVPAGGGSLAEYAWSHLPKNTNRFKLSFKEYIESHQSDFEAIDDVGRVLAAEKFMRLYPDDEIPFVLRPKE